MAGGGGEELAMGSAVESADHQQHCHQPEASIPPWVECESEERNSFLGSTGTACAIGTSNEAPAVAGPTEQNVSSSLPPTMDEVRQTSAGLPQPASDNPPYQLPGVHHVDKSSGYDSGDTANLTARECMIVPNNGPQEGGTLVSISLSSSARVDNTTGATVLWESTTHRRHTRFDPRGGGHRVPNDTTVVVNTPVWPRPEKVEVKVVDARDSTKVLGITEFEFTMNTEELLRQEALAVKSRYEQLMIWKESQLHDGGQTLHAESLSSEEMRQVAECCNNYGRLANLFARLEPNSTVIHKRAPKTTKKTNKQKRVASANRNIESSMSSTDSAELTKKTPKFRRHGCLADKFYTEPETDECPANFSQQEHYRDTSLSEDDEKQQGLKKQQWESREERSNADILPSGVLDHVQSKEKFNVNGDAFTEEKLDPDNGLNVLYTEEPKFDSSNSTSSQKFEGNTKSAIQKMLLKLLFKIISSLQELREGRKGLQICFPSLQEQKYSRDLLGDFKGIICLNKTYFVASSKSRSFFATTERFTDKIGCFLVVIVIIMCSILIFYKQLDKAERRLELTYSNYVPIVEQEFFNICLQLMSTRKLLPSDQDVQSHYQEWCF